MFKGIGKRVYLSTLFIITGGVLSAGGVLLSLAGIEIWSQKVDTRSTSTAQKVE